MGKQKTIRAVTEGQHVQMKEWSQSAVEMWRNLWRGMLLLTFWGFKGEPQAEVSIQ